MAKPPSPLVQDGLLAVALGAVSFIPGVSAAGMTLGELPHHSIDALAVVLAAAQCLPLVLRRRYPATVLGVVGVAFALYDSIGYTPLAASWGLLPALYTAGTVLGRRWQIGAAVAYLPFVAVLRVRGSQETALEYVTFFVVLAACWGAGAWVRRRRAVDAEAERARIARELHDVVTHHVTAMVVQADAAQYVPNADLSVISDTGRLALKELRHLLDVLHAGPDLKIGELVERAVGTGQPVTLREEGSPELLAAGAELAAYRVVQEGLTNAMKHAQGQPTKVNVRYGTSATEIEVLTDGPPVQHSGGHGLDGLKERVSVFGGTVSSGGRPAGGFRLYARIPAKGPRR
ncbi:sensor histidine kinase [Winogradskya humida]|uniref:histidine kinase n=1 Tax=Winogradskya humida TaxID=113566 RepID=A0ABQ3ZW62_9ACTN|nr:histidine kinase [Actinoplanes humidus]GIE22788.1 two-component sensor histidine kinase [Actinoplanes humidus]